MDFYYRTLQAPILKKKEYKKQSEKSYWKKFKPFISEQYPSAVSNIKFAGNLLAMTSKTLLKVYDINNYKSKATTESDEDKEEEEFNLFAPKPQSFQTKETRSYVMILTNYCYHLLEKIVLIGDKQGKISLIPRQTSFRPLSVFNTKSKITSIQFNSHQITQFACANSMNEITLWQLSDYRKPKFTIRKAHQDLIKDINYSKDSQSVIFSISYDRTMRRWDTRQKINIQSSIILKNDQPFETLCFIPRDDGDNNYFLTGSGRSVKLWDLRKLSEDCIMSKQVHSKTISKLAYFKKQQSRVLSASHDGNLRVLAIKEDIISSIYGIRFGSEILSLDTSDEAFAVGAYNGGLWSLQKRQLNQLQKGKEEQQFQFKRIQKPRENTGKSRVYFNRGAYDKFSDIKHDDNNRLQIIAPKSQKRDKITKYLKKFEYKSALDCCINQKQQNITKIITLVKELQLRNALDISLKDRSNSQILNILRMINWKIMDDRYTETMCTLLNRILHLYAYSLPYDSKSWNEIEQIIQKSNKFTDIATKLIEIKGQIDSLLFIIQNIKSQ